ALVNVGGGPRCLVNLAGMLRDQLSNHLKMAELLHRDVLQHVANTRVLDVEGLHPVLQCRSQLAGRTSKLLQEKGSKTRIWFANLDGLDQLLRSEEHTS